MPARQGKSMGGIWRGLSDGYEHKKRARLGGLSGSRLREDDRTIRRMESCPTVTA